jgi:hypothetical protein
MGNRGLPLLLSAWLLGCPTEEQIPLLDADVELEPSETVPTVMTVRWPVGYADRDGQHVEFGIADREPRMVAPAQVHDGVATAVLLGMKPATAYALRVAEAVDGDVVRSAPYEFSTGSPPADLPELTVEVLGPETQQGFIVTSLIADTSTVVVIDPDGDYVWWHQLPPVAGEGWDDHDVPKALLTRDRRAIVYQVLTGTMVGDDPSVERLLVQVSLDGDQGDTTSVPGAHHDFTELPDGTLALLVEDDRMVDDLRVDGDKLAELSPDGTLTDVWSVWDCAEFDPGAEYDPGTGWSHANAVEYVPATDSYLVSLRNFDAIYEVDRTSGDLLRVFGGEDSDYHLTDGSTDLFDRQHQVVALTDSLLVFDNRLPEVGSRVVEYRFHDDSGGAELLWEHTADPPLFSIGFGDVRRLASGNTLIDWSGAGQIDEVEPGGDVVWSLHTEPGVGLGYMHHVESLY